jgi:hypothetical protein
MTTYTKYITPIAAKICQRVWFVVHDIQNSVILLIIINVAKQTEMIQQTLMYDHALKGI